MTLKWRFTEHWWGEKAVFKAAGMKAVVIDYDGDGSGWRVQHGRRILASEDNILSVNPYHFDVALERAEEAFRTAARMRKAAIKPAAEE